MIESDIEDYVRWFTVDREWENWDAPWEKEDTNVETERNRWTEYYESVKDHPVKALRRKIEIKWNGRHIDWISSYCIDEKYECIGKNKDGQKAYRAIGIDICESNLCGKGIGTIALGAFINYYFENSTNEIYIQTWSGNVRMIRCT